MKYSLFIVVMKETMSMEAKGQMGAAPAASPLLSSQYSDLYYILFVSMSPCREIARRTYLVDNFIEPKFATEGPTRQELVPPHG
jgi:hypothetical protein